MGIQAPLRDLDPFAGFPGMISRVKGLPGHVPSHVPPYVLHTDYVPVERGRRVFRVEFAGLRASRGNLSLRVHMMPADRSANAKLVDSERFSLTQLADGDGAAAISFQGYAGMIFALYALISDDTDAAAEGVHVTIDGDPNPALDAPSEEVFDDDTAHHVLPTPLIMSLDRPRFAMPVSQPFTEEQLTETDFRSCLDALGGSAGGGREAWPAAFLYQTLRKYGFLKPGGKGVCLGRGNNAVRNALAAAGIQVIVLDGGNDGAPAPIPAPDAIGDDIGNAHFLWSDSIVERHPDPWAATVWMRDLCTQMALGAFAIHFLPTSLRGGKDADGRLSFSRSDLERAALTLIAFGHDVAQIRVRGLATDGLADVPFALVVRRGQPTG